MTIKSPLSQPSFNAVGAGQTATIDLAPDGTYHMLLVHYTEGAVDAIDATMRAAITAIRLKVNGKVQRTFSAAELLDINALKGQVFTAGYLQIFFAEPWRRAAQGEDALAWGMGDVDTFQMEIDIAAGRVNPALSLTAVKTRDAAPMGPIVKWRRFSVPVGAIGITTLTTLPRFDNYYAIHAFSSVIDDVEVKSDQDEVFKATLAEVALLEATYGRSQQTGLFSLDFDYTNRAFDVIEMQKNGVRINDFRVDFNMSAATAFTVVTETLGLRD